MSSTRPARTPGKGLSSRARTENLLTTRRKNAKQTPFRSNTHQSNKNLFDDAGVKPTTTTTTNTGTASSRALLDKTPFPNRTRDANAFHTPFPTAKLAFLEPGAADDGTPVLFPRPSSTRKHIRVPRSASRSFETPLNKTANPWDFSELDICLTQPEQSLLLSEPSVEEDHDEVEYVPPRPVDPPYCPPFDFDLPNYKELGARLLEQARSYPIDDSVPSPLDHEYEGEFMTSPAQWSVRLPDLDSDDDRRSVEKVTGTKNRNGSRVKATGATGKRMDNPPQHARGQASSRALQPGKIAVPSRASSQSRAGAGSRARTVTTPGARSTDALQKTGLVSQRSVGVSARRPAPRDKNGVKGDDELLLNVQAHMEDSFGDFLFSAGA